MNALIYFTIFMVLSLIPKAWATTYVFIPQASDFKGSPERPDTVTCNKHNAGVIYFYEKISTLFYCRGHTDADAYGSRLQEGWVPIGYPDNIYTLDAVNLADKCVANGCRVVLENLKVQPSSQAKSGSWQISFTYGLQQKPEPLQQSLRYPRYTEVVSRNAPIDPEPAMLDISKRHYSYWNREGWVKMSGEDFVVNAEQGRDGGFVACYDVPDIRLNNQGRVEFAEGNITCSRLPAFNPHYPARSCERAEKGNFFYNPDRVTLEYCDGRFWQPITTRLLYSAALPFYGAPPSTTKEQESIVYSQGLWLVPFSLPADVAVTVTLAAEDCPDTESLFSLQQCRMVTTATRLSSNLPWRK